MRQLQKKLTRTTSWLAGGLAGLITLFIPLIFFGLSYQFHRASLNVEANHLAANVSNLINANPEFWQFEEPRLNMLLKDQADEGLPEARRILDSMGRVIVQTSEQLASPTMMDSANLMDSGNIVGRFEVIRSMRPLLLTTALVSLASLMLGGLVLLALRIYPLKALKQALGMLADEKERAEAILRSISDAVLTIDASGRVLSFNPAAEKIFGYALKEVLDHHIKMLMPERFSHERTDFLADFEGTNKSNAVLPWHASNGLRKNGAIFPLDLAVNSLDQSDQRIFTVTVRDITERKQAEIEVLRASDLLRGSINALDEAFVIYDPQDRLVLCNDKYRQMYSELAHLMVPGAQFEDLLRASAEMGLHVAAIGRVDEWVAERLTIHLAANTTSIQKLSNGRNLRIYERRLPDGHIVGFRIDITESQRAQDEILRLNTGLEERVVQLRESTEKLRFAADAADLYDWEWDVPRDTLTWGRDPVHVLGQPDERTGKYPDFRDLVHPEDRERYLAVGRHSMKTGETYSLEFRILGRDGAVRWVAARGKVVFDSVGAPARMLGVSQDITERKQAQAEILRLNASLEERVQKRTAQLQAANQDLEAFSYSVSHDLRSPLNTINGFSSLLDKEISAAGSSERSKHYFARIRAGAQQMGELIDAMLSLAQVSRNSLIRERVDLSAVAQTLLNGYREREPGRVVQFNIEPGLIAEGDPHLLRDVLENLLGNAWKFSAKKACSQITFGHQKSDIGETVYFVRDNGAGFDMAYSEKLFGPFQRLHTVSEFTGTGIGLASVQKIVLRHGGRVWFDSVPEQGATFYFTLGEKLLETG